MAPRVVLAAGAVVLVLALVLGGTRADRLVLGSNDIRPETFVAVLPPDKVLCQTAQDVPAETGYLALTLGTYGRPGPELRTAVQDPSGAPAVAPGRLAAGWTQGRILVPLGANTKKAADVRICIANRGKRAIAFGGAMREPRVSAIVGGRAARGRVSMFYLSGERRTPLSLAGGIADRMGDWHGVWGGASPWAVLVLVALVVGLVARAMWSPR